MLASGCNDLMRKALKCIVETVSNKLRYYSNLYVFLLLILVTVETGSLP